MPGMLKMNSMMTEPTSTAGRAREQREDRQKAVSERVLPITQRLRPLARAVRT